MGKGDRIRMLRERKGLTQEELGRLLNTTRQTISKYEKEIVTNIPSDRIEAIARLLDSTPEYLLGWEQEIIEENNDLIASVVVKMRTDENFFNAVSSLYKAFTQQTKDNV